VVANYVLNTLTPDARAEAFLQAYIAGQYAIFTVRLDRVDGEPFEDGVITKRGTFQKSFSRSECEELGRVLTYNSSFAIIDLY
jgi:hypothetical protein